MTTTTSSSTTSSVPITSTPTSLTSTATVTTSQHKFLDRVALRIPPFWPEDPELWFAQIESQFTIAGIVTDETRYGYVAGNLEAKYAMEVRDILTNPPASNKYDFLKVNLIKRLSESQEHKTRRLLEREELGDRKPSQFLRHLQLLAGPLVTENLLRSIWMGRLPPSMQAILATQNTSPLSTVADLADAVFEATSPSVSAVSTATPSPPTDIVRELTAAIANMTATLREEISAIANEQPRRREVNDRQRSRSRSRSQGHSCRCPTNPDLCWYHDRFGNQARKCIKPCKFATGRYVREEMPQVRVIKDTSVYHALLSKFPEITRPSGAPTKTKHSTCHYIRTTPGPP
ncbi:hypothetical protein NQ315_017537, partial [Exocentrus adspersus]